MYSLTYIYKTNLGYYKKDLYLKNINMISKKNCGHLKKKNQKFQTKKMRRYKTKMYVEI